MLKKITVIVIFIFAALQAGFSQNSNTVIATVRYKFKYVKNKRTVIDDICVLEIAKNKSYFYGEGLAENLRRIQEKAAKMSNGGNSIDLGQINNSDMVHNICPFKIIKDYTNKKAILVQHIGQQNLGFIRDTMDSRRWIMSGETKKIDRFLCHNATMKKDTSTITAWFCTNIPLPEGPYYYYGLPGLIIEASSTSGFTSDLLSINYNKDSNRELDIDQYILVTQSQMQKAAINQNAAFKNGQLPNGDEMKPKSGVQ